MFYWKAMYKTFILVLILVSTSMSLIVVKPVQSVDLPTPSVPEFTVEYNVESFRVVLIIQNEPFDPDDYDGEYHFYYNVRFDSVGVGSWTEIYRPSCGFLGQDLLHDYTKATYSKHLEMDGKLLTIPYGEVEFQVEAMIGIVHRQVMGGMAPWVFGGKTSGWSESRTVYIEPPPSIEPEKQETPVDSTPETPTTPEPEAPENIEPETTHDEQTQEESTPDSESSQLEQLAVILGVVATTIALAALVVGLMIYFKMQKDTKTEH